MTFFNTGLTPTTHTVDLFVFPQVFAPPSEGPGSRAHYMQHMEEQAQKRYDAEKAAEKAAAAGSGGVMGVLGRAATAAQGGAGGAGGAGEREFDVPGIGMVPESQAGSVNIGEQLANFKKWYMEGGKDEEGEEDPESKNAAHGDKLEGPGWARGFLKMGPGKVAAQCCHATIGCYKQASKNYPFGLKCWEITGCAKVATKLPTDVDQNDEFNKIRAKCKELGVACYLVEDAGRTQIAAGSKTVIGVGPAPVAVVDQICSEYKLL